MVENQGLTAGLTLAIRPMTPWRDWKNDVQTTA